MFSQLTALMFFFSLFAACFSFGFEKPCLRGAAKTSKELRSTIATHLKSKANIIELIGINKDLAEAEARELLSRDTPDQNEARRIYYQSYFFQLALEFQRGTPQDQLSTPVAAKKLGVDSYNQLTFNIINLWGLLHYLRNVRMGSVEKAPSHEFMEGLANGYITRIENIFTQFGWLDERQEHAFEILKRFFLVDR